MKKVARLRIAQDEQFVPPGVKVNANPEQSVRTTGRIKKPKAVFDPSDNYMPRSHRLSISVAAFATNNTTTPVKAPSVAAISPKETVGRRERSLSTGSNTSHSSVSANNGDVCIVCLKREPRRGGNYRNKLISCVVCGKRVHKLCMKSDFLDSAPLRQSFKCDNCRTCIVCSYNAKIAAISCIKCCKTYHFGCHTPKLSKSYQTERNWKCNKCQPVTPTGSNPSTTTSNSSKNINNDAVMPVKIIRQIIGDNVNLMSSAHKETQQTQTQPNSKESAKLQQRKSLQQHQHISKTVQSKKRQEPSEERVNISEAAVEASIKAATERRSNRTDSDTSTSSTASSSDDDSNDEDYEYVEKKKRRTANEHNNNNHDDVNIPPSPPDVKPSLNDLFKNSIKELPKREVVKAWSVEQVAQYVGEYFPKEAYVFKEQEIDGNALLLLKRSDVVQKLPLKLGPSLRLYNLILKVQTQTANDPTLGWDCSVDTLLGTTE